MMSLEQPAYIFFNGVVVRWELAQVHIWSETAIRATNVFEGLRAYWIDELKEWRVVGVNEHLDRLINSARLLRIPHQFTHTRIISIKVSDFLEPDKRTGLYKLIASAQASN